MRKYLFIILIVTAAISLMYAQTSQITCSGSTTVLPIAQAAAEAYMDLHPSINISVRGGGSGVGIAALQNGTVHIANSSRPMKASEAEACEAKGFKPAAYAIANDGIAILVHHTNPLKNITISQLKDIYTGKIVNWKELGGKDLPIVVISRDVSSGTFEVFNEKALSGEKVISSAQLLASNNAVVTAVSNTPGGIGYAGLGYITDDVRVVSVNKIEPTLATIQDGSYPLSRKLFMFTRGKATGDVERFIAWIQSDEGQKIVTEQGFVPIN
nr:phosphate transport system substrate-binding protein [Candidatus Cloacimonadota bacterium]